MTSKKKKIIDAPATTAARTAKGDEKRSLTMPHIPDMKLSGKGTADISDLSKRK
jgi:hypothetical protein